VRGVGFSRLADFSRPRSEQAARRAASKGHEVVRLVVAPGRSQES